MIINLYKKKNKIVIKIVLFKIYQKMMIINKMMTILLIIKDILKQKNKFKAIVTLKYGKYLDKKLVNKN